MPLQQSSSPGLHLEMLARPESVALARDAVRDCIAVPRAVLDDLMLVVSELVTNAVRHAGLAGEDTVLLAVSCLGDSVHVTVTDRGPGFDRARAEAKIPSEHGGWGLDIVTRLSQAWGVIPGAGVVWADVAADEASPLTAADQAEAMRVKMTAGTPAAVR
jgi:anti-sigma regulatory factor (Ser/Thr protein kinase)